MEKPCSIVVYVKEIFGSESKTQVYAHLHNLFEKPSMVETSKPLNSKLFHIMQTHVITVSNITTVKWSILTVILSINETLNSELPV